MKISIKFIIKLIIFLFLFFLFLTNTLNRIFFYYNHLKIQQNTMLQSIQFLSLKSIINYQKLKTLNKNQSCQNIHVCFLLFNNSFQKQKM